jgi:hypothetical protein
MFLPSLRIDFSTQLIELAMILAGIDEKSRQEIGWKF